MPPYEILDGHPAFVEEKGSPKIGLPFWAPFSDLKWKMYMVGEFEGELVL